MKKLLSGLLAVVLVAAGAVAAAATIALGVSTQASGSCGADGADGPVTAAHAAASAGFTGEDLVVAVAVAGAESDYRPDARNSIGASGLWQILESAHRDLFTRYDWRDPAQNAAMAYAVWTAAGRSWAPWTTWTSGTYLDHRGEATSAIARLSDVDADSCPPVGGGPSTPAVPFSGPDGYVDDPTSGGRITRRMLHVYDEVNRVFARWPWGVGCWDQHAWNPTSDHPLGRACDFAVGTLGRLPQDAEQAVGWQLASWLRSNASALGVSYVIWDGQIWSVSRDEEGWRQYSGGGVYDPTSPTGGHFDHVHCSAL